MANKFLTNIELDAGIVDGSNSTGTSGYVLSSTGTATSWVDPAALAVGESEQVHIACKNTSGVAISKGDPVYITGTVGASYIIEIAKADASNSAKMPAVGLVETDLGLNDEGFVIVSGVLKNLTTDPLSTGDGTPSSNNTVYVKAGGGLTRTKPTGSGNLIQNVGKVGRVQGTSAGSIAVSTIMRTNDVPNLTTGKIWVGSPTYTTESTVVHLDETNGRMGIGTTDPKAKFQVIGPSDASVPAAGSGVGGTAIFSSDLNTYGMFVGSITNGNGYIQQQRTNTATYYNLLLQPNGGNVGIGTTSPSEKLSVVGNLLLNNSGEGWIKGYDNYHSIKFRAGGANKTEYYEYGGTLSAGLGHKFFTGGTTGQTLKFQIADDGAYFSGNVGIGTTSPQSGGSAASWLNLNGTAAYSGGVVYTINNSAKAYHYVEDTFLIHQGQGGIGHRFFANGSEKMRIESGGNVGIGTTSPDVSLEVVAASPTDGIIADFVNSTNAGGTTAAIKLSNSDSESCDVILGANRVGADFGSDFFISTSNGIDGSNSERFRITESGNIGIGTTSPSQKLTVEGNIELGTGGYIYGDTTTPALRLNNSSGSYLQYGTGTYFAAGNNALTFRTSSSTRMFINSLGNVGIGTTTPSQKLHVVGASNFEGAVQVSGGTFVDSTRRNIYLNSFAGGDGNGIFFRDGFTYNASITVEDHNGAAADGICISGYDGVSFSTGADSKNERMRITSAGNVGINITAPTEKLAVNGNIETTETANGVKIGFNVGDSFTLNGSNTAHYGLSCGVSTSVPLVLSGYYGVAIATNGLERVRILQSNGYVGILNTAPSYALDVTGTIRATGNVIAFSDARAKENIKTIDSALEKVNKLRGVEFNKIGEEKTCIGVIAQEVEEVLPEVVETDDNGMKAVAYGNMVGLLIEAMKEQQKQIDELKAKLESYGS